MPAPTNGQQQSKGSDQAADKQKLSQFLIQKARTIEINEKGAQPAKGHSQGKDNKYIQNQHLAAEFNRFQQQAEQQILQIAPVQAHQDSQATESSQSNQQLPLQEYSQTDGSLENQKLRNHQSNDLNMVNNKKTQLNLQNTIKINKVHNLSIEMVNEFNQEQIKPLIKPSSQTTKNQHFNMNFRLNNAKSNDQNKLLKLKFNQNSKNVTSQEKLDKQKKGILHQNPPKINRENKDDIRPLSNANKNKLIEAPFHHNKVIDQRQQAPPAARKAGHVGYATTQQSPQKNSQQPHLVDSQQLQNKESKAQAKVVTSQDHFIKIIQDQRKEEHHTDLSLQDAKEVLNKSQKSAPNNQNNTHGSSQLQNQNTKFKNYTKAAAGGQRFRRKPTEPQDKHYRQSQGYERDGQEHHKLLSLERITKTGYGTHQGGPHQAHHKVNETNQNIISNMQFVNNSGKSGSIEMISNIIDEKFSDINMSQYSSNDNAVSSNLSGLIGAIAAGNAKNGLTQPSTHDQYLSSGDETQFLNQRQMNGQLGQGEIVDLKKKIYQRDECIRELVKKINQIEKCVQTLQANNGPGANSGTNDNKQISKNVKMASPSDLKYSASKSLDRHYRTGANAQNSFVKNFKSSDSQQQSNQNDKQGGEKERATPRAHTVFPADGVQKQDRTNPAKRIPKINMIQVKQPQDSQFISNFSQNSAGSGKLSHPINQKKYQMQNDSIINSVDEEQLTTHGGQVVHSGETSRQSIIQLEDIITAGVLPSPEEPQPIAPELQNENRPVSKQSDYPRYLGRIDSIINRWNKKMADFDIQNDQIKQQGTTLNANNQKKPPLRDTVRKSSDETISKQASINQMKRNVGFLRTSECLFNPTSSRLGRSESMIEDYQSSNMNALSARLRNESPIFYSESNQNLDQFRAIDIIEPHYASLPYSNKVMLSLQKQSECTPCQPIDDMHFKNAQETPRQNKLIDFAHQAGEDDELQIEVLDEAKNVRSRKQKGFNANLKVNRKLIDELKRANETENDFKPMFNNLFEDQQTPKRDIPTHEQEALLWQEKMQKLKLQNALKAQFNELYQLPTAQQEQVGPELKLATKGSNISNFLSKVNKEAVTPCGTGGTIGQPINLTSVPATTTNTIQKHHTTKGSYIQLQRPYKAAQIVTTGGPEEETQGKRLGKFSTAKAAAIKTQRAKANLDNTIDFSQFFINGAPENQHDLLATAGYNIDCLSGSQKILPTVTEFFRD